MIGAPEHALNHQGNLSHEPRKLPHGRPNVHGDHHHHPDDDIDVDDDGDDDDLRFKWLPLIH